MMISLIIFGLIYAYILNDGEAKIDSLTKNEKGEPHDYNKKSEVWVSFFLFTLFPLSLIFAGGSSSLIFLSLLWIGVRSFFDLMYNYHRDFHWSYLGTTATTDSLLKKINPELLLLVRALILVLTILICFIYA
jgi:hypothetical protein